MSLNTIKKFIKTLSEGDYTQLDYDYKKYDCEMSALMPIICSQESDKYDGIVDFWNKKQESDYFEMQHPLHNHITTRAVFSFFKPHTNYVFFADETNEYIWCAIQTQLTFSWFFADGVLYTVAPLQQDYHLNFSFMQDISCEQLAYKDIKFGFFFNHTTTLWHFTHDTFGNIYEINLQKPLKNLPYFFIPNHANLTDEERVFLWVGWSMMFHTPAQRGAVIKRRNENMTKDSLVYLSKNLQDNDNYDLVMWFGLTYYNNVMKTWLEQINGTVNIIKELQKTFKKIKIYFDGMKAAENGDKSPCSSYIDNATAIINEISSQLKDVEIVSLNGYSVKDAVCICSQIDIAITECAMGSYIPVVFCKKPTIMYGNNFYLANTIYDEHTFWVKRDEKTTRFVDSKYVKSIYTPSEDWFVWSKNYHMVWQHIYNLTAELLENLSQDKKLKILDLKLNRLEVPPVELIAKQYEIGQKLGLDIPLEVCEEDADRILCTFSTKELNLAKARIQNHLSYKLGQALIINSKSLWGYLRMPYVLSYIKDKHKQDQKVCRSKIREENPHLALMPLENYPEEALKEKNSFTYKLGQAFIKASKNWYGGGGIEIYLQRCA